MFDSPETIWVINNAKADTWSSTRFAVLRGQCYEIALACFIEGANTEQFGLSSFFFRKEPVLGVFIIQRLQLNTSQAFVIVTHNEIAAHVRYDDVRINCKVNFHCSRLFVFAKQKRILLDWLILGRKS